MGLAASAFTRFTAYYRTGYREGRAAALLEVHREAIREGHGHWERDERGGPNRFAWNAVRHAGFAPDAITAIQEGSAGVRVCSWLHAVEGAFVGPEPREPGKR
ncbi:hypothetical protein Pan44_53170 [Caulifigura coniformis]|uniref:Uncharacterized protein n=2 Tax=Caulifigura coniformis TaxID=2527983 RepID=A0A517SM91_9PLAN|nr:hypothetical protein Pan44_53170 [Caulifigura coniformis]